MRKPPVIGPITLDKVMQRATTLFGRARALQKPAILIENVFFGIPGKIAEGPVHQDKGGIFRSVGQSEGDTGPA